MESYYESEFDVRGQNEETSYEASSVDSVNTHVPKLTFDEKKQKLEGDITKETVMKFILENKLPNLIYFSEEVSALSRC